MIRDWYLEMEIKNSVRKLRLKLLNRTTSVSTFFFFFSKNESFQRIVQRCILVERREEALFSRWRYRFDPKRSVKRIIRHSSSDRGGQGTRNFLIKCAQLNANHEKSARTLVYSMESSSFNKSENVSLERISSSRTKKKKRNKYRYQAHFFHYWYWKRNKNRRKLKQQRSY